MPSLTASCKKTAPPKPPCNFCILLHASATQWFRWSPGSQVEGKLCGTRDLWSFKTLLFVQVGTWGFLNSGAYANTDKTT